jgi:hypothetical protein
LNSNKIKHTFGGTRTPPHTLETRARESKANIIDCAKHQLKLKRKKHDLKIKKDKEGKEQGELQI